MHPCIVDPSSSSTQNESKMILKNCIIYARKFLAIYWPHQTNLEVEFYVRGEIGDWDVDIDTCQFIQLKRKMAELTPSSNESQS